MLSARWSLRQQRKDLCDLSHSLRPAFAEQQSRSDVDVLRSVEESEHDDGLLVGAYASLMISCNKTSHNAAAINCRVGKVGYGLTKLSHKPRDIAPTVGSF